MSSVLKRHSLKENTISTWPSNCLPLFPPTTTPRFSWYFLSQGPLQWLATLPKKLSSLICNPEGSPQVQVPSWLTQTHSLLVWVSAQTLSSKLRPTSGCAAPSFRILPHATSCWKAGGRKALLLEAQFQGRVMVLKSDVDTGMTAQKNLYTPSPLWNRNPPLWYGPPRHRPLLNCCNS